MKPPQLEWTTNGIDWEAEIPKHYGLQVQNQDGSWYTIETIVKIKLAYGDDGDATEEEK